MKKHLFILAFLVSNATFSQTINDYKYAIVPSKFSFLKEKNQYNLNALTKIFMNEFGFITFLDSDPLPMEIINQNCSKIYVDVIENNSMFLTRLSVVLKDCEGKVLLTSLEGKSKEKEFKVAYNEALRAALKSLGNKKEEIKKEETELKTTEATATEATATENTGLKEAIAFEIETINNGYLLLDASTETVYLKLLRTSEKNVFIGLSKTKNGIVLKKDSEYIFEYYENNKLISEKLNIKF